METEENKMNINSRIISTVYQGKLAISPGKIIGWAAYNRTRFYNNSFFADENLHEFIEEIRKCNFERILYLAPKKDDERAISQIKILVQTFGDKKITAVTRKKIEEKFISKDQNNDECLDDKIMDECKNRSFPAQNMQEALSIAVMMTEKQGEH